MPSTIPWGVQRLWLTVMRNKSISKELFPAEMGVEKGRCKLEKNVEHKFDLIIDSNRR